MANSFKNIVITPNIANSADPNIVFNGANATVNASITLYMYPAANGTLSFEGTAGQLLSIKNDLSNDVFTAADVGGNPLIAAYANGAVNIAPVYGNVSIANGRFIANSTQLGIYNVPLYANGSAGTRGYILTSNGTTGSPFWDTKVNITVGTTAPSSPSVNDLWVDTN